MDNYLKINSKDNVAVALVDLAAGFDIKLDDASFALAEDIKNSHKFALCDIAEGEKIIKYGMPIGKAVKDIKQGEWVHVNNLKTGLGKLEEYSYNPVKCDDVEIEKDLMFNGYLRTNGDVGVRNDIWIIPSVGCINKTCENLASMFKAELNNDGIDDVNAYPHPYGCSQLGDDHVATQQILAGLIHNPNAGGVLVVGLGCENNTLDSFKEIIGPVDEKRVRFMVVQEVEDEIEVGLELLRELAEYVSTFKRQPVPISKLRVGLKCGGSDGLSGITANTVVGAFSDLLIQKGGTSVLTEVPEMFGAETLLMDRCINEDVFNKCVNMINGFKEYFMRYNQVVYENPSPGNKDGGISTLEEKSLGCVQKGGLSQVVDVLDYGEHLDKPGLNLITGPGNDMVAVTVLAAAGAQIVLFTTGRGNPFGGPVPTMKISSNTTLANNKKHWIDFNAGELVEGKTLDEMKNALYSAVLDVAEGKQKVCNERFGYKEIAIFKDGVTL